LREQAIRLDDAPLKSDLAAHLTMLYEVRRRSRQFDVLHFHVDMLHFPMFEQHAHKTVTTLHGRLDLKDLPQVYARWPQFGLVSISMRSAVRCRPLAGSRPSRTAFHPSYQSSSPRERSTSRFSAASPGKSARSGHSPGVCSGPAAQIAAKVSDGRAVFRA
jgi:hypothetical protein